MKDCKSVLRFILALALLNTRTVSFQTQHDIQGHPTETHETIVCQNLEGLKTSCSNICFFRLVLRFHVVTSKCFLQILRGLICPDSCFSLVSSDVVFAEDPWLLRTEWQRPNDALCRGSRLSVVPLRDEVWLKDGSGWSCTSFCLRTQSGRCLKMWKHLKCVTCQNSITWHCSLVSVQNLGNWWHRSSRTCPDALSGQRHFASLRAVGLANHVSNVGWEVWPVFLT